MTTPDRFGQLHDEYLEEWADANQRYLYEVCADIPPEPEVQAILQAWEEGSDEKPWLDAGEVTDPGKSSQVSHVTHFGKPQNQQVTDLGKSA